MSRLEPHIHVCVMILDHVIEDVTNTGAGGLLIQATDGVVRGPGPGSWSNGLMCGTGVGLISSARYCL